MKTAVDDRRGFLWVKRKITREEAQRLRDLKLDWIEFRTESQRFYPNRSLAAHVIGSVDFEEDGNGGVEQSLNERLAGHAGEMLVTEDVQRRGFASKMEDQPQPGQDVHLTIDSRIQFVAERESGEDGGGASRQIGQRGGHGPAHRRHSCDGERADLRSE